MEWSGILAWLDAPHAELARQVLLGERGLQPTPRFIAACGLAGQPSICRWHYSDRLLRILCLICIAIALTLVAGLPQLGPPWVPMLTFLAL